MSSTPTGQTILLTTHYMEEADQLCDRVAIMDHGKILALDTPEGLKRSVGVDTIVTVKASRRPRRASPHALEAGLEGVTKTRDRRTMALELHVRGGERLLARVVAAAEERRLRRRRPFRGGADLETVFINLTGKELRD